MKARDKIINLFCIYTVLSIAISMLAWAAVGLELLSVSPFITSNISATGWVLGCLIYMFGLYSVYRLHNYARVSIVVFGAYIFFQVIALVSAYMSNGWYYAPSAGSQGTLPALVISCAMLFYLLSKHQASQKNA